MMSKPSSKKTLANAIRLVGTLLSSALFIWLISHQNWDLVLEKAAGIPLWGIFLALFFYLLSFGFNTLRWCILLWAQDVPITFWQAFRMTWAGNFASNFLPSTIGGDGLRLVGIFRYTDRKTVAIGSIALDRIINMAAMACLLPVPLLIFGGSLGKLFAAPALAVPAGLQKVVQPYFSKIETAFHTWASRPWSFVYAFLAAWPSNLFPMAATYLIARQLDMDVSFWQVAGVQTVAYFVTVLPISVNGIGWREMIYASLYTTLGATLEQASTLALVTRFITLLVTVPGAFWLSGAVTDAALNADETTGIEP